MLSISTIIIIIGIALIAKFQFEILKYRYKQAEICPEKLFADGRQSFLLTKLSEKRPQRPTIFIPLLGRRVKCLLLSELIGAALIIGGVYFSFVYTPHHFTTLFSIALGGLSWIFITKLVLTFSLKLCDYPSGKLVVASMLAYPILLLCLHCLLHILIFFNLYNPPYYINL